MSPRKRKKKEKLLHSVKLQPDNSHALSFCKFAACAFTETLPAFLLIKSIFAGGAQAVLVLEIIMK